MAFKSTNPSKVARAIVLKDGYEATTATGHITLTEQSSTFQAIDPDGVDRNVTLPKEEGNNGLRFVLHNTGSAGEDLTILNDAGATIRVINAGECTCVICSGTVWAEFPMSGFATIASIDDNGYLYGGLDNDWYLHHDNDKGLEIGIADNDATALVVLQGADNYLVVDTRNGVEIITLGNAVTNPDLSMLGSGQITLTGNVDCSTGLDVAGGAQTFTGTNLDLDPTGTFDLSMDAGQAFAIAIAGAASSIMLTASGAGHDFTLAVAGAFDVSLVLSSAGTGADALQVTASAGGMDVTAAGDLDIVGTTSADFGDGTGAVHYAAGALSLTGTTTIDLDGSGAVSLESSAGAINVGADAVAQPVNIGTGAAARPIQVGNAASASCYIEGGVGALRLDCDVSLEINCSADAINIGNDAVAQPVNIATGNAARVITVGHAASASLALEGGVGGLTADCDGALELNSSAGAIGVGNDNVAQALNLGTAGARAIAIGSAAAASLALEGGVGPVTIDADIGIAIECSAGAIDIGLDNVAQALNLGTGGARAIAVGSAAAASVGIDAGIGSLSLTADVSIPLDTPSVVITTSSPVVSNAAAETMDFHDDVLRAVDPAAPTKAMRLDAGAVTAGQTRVAAAADWDTDLAMVAREATVEISTAQVLALFTTPIELVPAPGATKIVVVQDVTLFLDYATIPYDGVAAAEDLKISYVDGAGREICRVETTGFLDQANDETRFSWPQPIAVNGTVQDFEIGANAPVVISLLVANIATGDSPLKVRVRYFVRDFSW